jgi:hypothetical protein
MRARLPVGIALAFLILGGVFLLHRADAQARDTIRKHHLEDIEQALYFARGQHGTYPPYDEPSWCGELSSPENSAVRQQVEEALRTQNEKYANLAKPFPADPLQANQSSPEVPPGRRGTDNAHVYFYWKRSPAVFELHAILENDRTGERETSRCSGAPAYQYDYGITSVWREDR